MKLADIFLVGTVFCLIALSSKYVEAYSSGPPLSACSTITPGHGNDVGNLGYALSLSPLQRDNKVTVDLYGTRDFRGVMLQARDQYDRVIGYFSDVPWELQLKDCTSAGGAVTHNNNDLKNNLVVTWNAPANIDEDVTFRATFVRNYYDWERVSETVRLRGVPMNGPMMTPTTTDSYTQYTDDPNPATTPTQGTTESTESTSTTTTTPGPSTSRPTTPRESDVVSSVNPGDDLPVNPGNQPENPPNDNRPNNYGYQWSCNFEDDYNELCYATQNYNDELDWVRTSGPTPSYGTGPDSAYSGSYYMHLEGTDVNYKDTAQLTLPDVLVPGKYCLTFAFHMFGYDINELSVHVVYYDQSWSKKVWSEQCDRGNNWIQTNMEVDILRESKIVIAANRGNGYQSDIAIDDIKLMSGRCTEYLAPPKQPDYPCNLDLMDNIIP